MTITSRSRSRSSSCLVISLRRFLNEGGGARDGGGTFSDDGALSLRFGRVKEDEVGGGGGGGKSDGDAGAGEGLELSRTTMISSSRSWWFSRPGEL